MSKIDKIGWLYIKDKKILSTLSIGKNIYYLPGGKRENNETDSETLIREVKEELSVDIVEKTINYYNTFEAQAHGKAEGILVQVTCYMADFTGKLNPSSEIQEMEWLTYKDLDKISQVDKLIFKDLYNKGLIE